MEVANAIPATNLQRVEIKLFFIVLAFIQAIQAANSEMDWD
jgi:hypothetical protein